MNTQWKKELSWFYDWWIKGEVKMAADNDPNSAWSWNEEAKKMTFADFTKAIAYLDDNAINKYTWIIGEQMAATLDKEIMKSVDEFVTVTDPILPHPYWKAKYTVVGHEGDNNAFNENWTPTETLYPRKRDVDKYDYLLEGK